MRVQADPQPVVGIALVRGGDRLLQHEPVVDLALVGREVVGVEGLDPVQCDQVLPGPLQLQGQGQGHEVEDLLDVVRGLGRIGDVGEELLADELAPVGQLGIGEGFGDRQGVGPQGRRQIAAEVARQLLVVAVGEVLRPRRGEPGLVAQIGHQLLVRGGLVQRPRRRWWNGERAQLGQQVGLRVGEDPDGRVPGAVAPHPEPLLVEVLLDVRLVRIERQLPPGRRVRRPQDRRLGLQPTGPQGQQHLLQRLQCLLGSGRSLVTAVAAVDAELAGQPFGDDRGVAITGDRGQARLPEHRQRCPPRRRSPPPGSPG